MPNQAPIVIKDGSAVPVDHTFSPVNVNADGVAKYTDKLGGIAIGYPTVTLQSKEATKQNRSAKVLGKIVLPVLEQIAGSSNTGFTPAPTVAFSLYFNFDFALPDRCTLQQRKDILAYARHTLADALLAKLVVDGEFIS